MNGRRLRIEELATFMAEMGWREYTFAEGASDESWRRDMTAIQKRPPPHPPPIYVEKARACSNFARPRKGNTLEVGTRYTCVFSELCARGVRVVRARRPLTA